MSVCVCVCDYDSKVMLKVVLIRKIFTCTTMQTIYHDICQV